MKPNPRTAELSDGEQTRVCEIRRIPNIEHMHRCVQAIRNREHPLWSWNGFRITGPKMRRVK